MKINCICYVSKLSLNFLLMFKLLLYVLAFSIFNVDKFLLHFYFQSILFPLPIVECNDLNVAIKQQKKKIIINVQDKIKTNQK